jgi:hypothetical protein
MNTLEGRFHGIDVASALDAAVDTAVRHLHEHLMNSQCKQVGVRNKCSSSPVVMKKRVIIIQYFEM